MSEPIYLKREDETAELVLNAPEKRNALSSAMWGAIPGLIERFSQDTDAKVLVLHGGDAGAFAAGADISEFETIYATPQSAATAGKTIAAALDALETCPKPTIAAIDGACVGGGVSLAMACDLRVAGDGAKFGVTPGKLGLVYPAADTRRLLAAIGPGATRDILFTGRIFQTAEAHRMGLVERVTGKGEALSAARTLAAEIGAISQWSTRATKAMIAGLQSGWGDDDKEAERLFLEGFSNADFADGYRAFLEKRPPNFKLR